MYKGLIRILLSGALLVMLVNQSAMADNVYAALRGVVTDSTGAALAGIQLTATNARTGVRTDTVSQNNGLYEFIQLPPGTYTLSAGRPGSKTSKATAIILAVGQVYNLPVSLQAGAAGETVEVKADAVQVDTTSIQRQTLIGARQIVDLPSGRNFTQFEQLAPGVMSSSDRFGTFSVNGSQSNQSSYLIDGADTNDIPLNGPLILPSPDALQEFNVISGAINPEYGRNSGAIVNALIKSGGNAFHGNVFDFYRDTFLNTHNFFSTTAPAFHQNLFGGTLGGPIWKDKTFFFLSYQGTRARTGNPTVTSVFSAAQRAGDFSGDTREILSNGFFGNVAPFPIVGDDGIVHPAGTPFLGFSASGAILNCGNFPFQGTCSNPNFAKLGTASFNPVALNLTNQFVPLPNAANNQFQFNPVNAHHVDQGIARIDHAINPANSVWGTMIFNHAPATETLPFSGANLPGFGEVDRADSKQFTAAYNHIFNATALNEVRLSYVRFNFGAVEPQHPALPSSFGFTGINPQDPAGASAPFIGVTGLFTLGFSANGPQPRKDQTYQFTDNFSKVAGRHTLKFGADIQRFQVDNPFFFNNNGSFSFSGNGQFSSGDPGLDFLLGVPDSFAQSAGGVIDARAYEYYLYAQDHWKARNNLTLTYGAGYQIDTPYDNNQFGGEALNCFQPGVQSTEFPTAPAGLTFPGDTGCNKAGSTTHYGHIGPRVGFAYSPNLGRLSGGSSSKFSIRGGYGIYFNRTEEGGALQNLGAPPFSANSFGAFAPGFANPFQNVFGGSGVKNIFPVTSFPKPGDPINFGSLSINVINPHFTAPYSQNFNLSMERELPGSTVVSAAYVGALGRHLYRAYEANPITAAGQAACAANPSCVGNRVIQHLLFPTHSPVNGNNFLSVGQQITDGTSNYNSLQLNITKGMTHGLYFTASYTYSHAIDNGSGFENSAFGTRGINVLDPRLNVGDSGFDARQRLVLGYNYAIPSLHSIASWAPDKIFGGWKTTGITTFQTGFPVNLSDTGFTSLSCDAFTFYACADNPNQISSAVQTVNPRTASFNGKNDFFFNPADFGRAAFGTFGNTRRDSLHGPGIDNTDFALLKDTKLAEGKILQLRIEGFNVFNHTQFGNPNTSIESSNFGRITTAAGGRLVELAAKLSF